MALLTLDSDACYLLQLNPAGAMPDGEFKPDYPSPSQLLRVTIAELEISAAEFAQRAHRSTLRR